MGDIAVSHLISKWVGLVTVHCCWVAAYRRPVGYTMNLYIRRYRSMGYTQQCPLSPSLPLHDLHFHHHLFRDKFGMTCRSTTAGQDYYRQPVWTGGKARAGKPTDLATFDSASSSSVSGQKLWLWTIGYLVILHLAMNEA